MFLNDWGALLPAWQEEFSDKFVEVEGNIVFTGRGGFEYDKEDDETVFDKYGLGDTRSKADKQIKATIIEKIFATKSQTEISKMDFGTLKVKRLQLEDMFIQLSAAQPGVEPENVIDWVISYHIKAAA